jgi:hypothetical protein
MLDPRAWRTWRLSWSILVWFASGFAFLDDEVDGGEVLVVAPGLAGFDADQVGAGLVDFEGVPGAGLGAGLEVHLEGGFEDDVGLDAKVGGRLLAGLLLLGDVEVDDDILQRLVRVDVGLLLFLCCIISRFSVRL